MILLLAVSAWAHIPDIYTTSADDDWCGVIASAMGGDYVMLAPGDYVGPCDIEGLVSDPEGEVTVVQSLDPLQPARFVHDGSSDYLLELTGQVLMLLQVDVGQVPEGVDAVRLGEGSDLMVRYSRFEGGAGRGVVQTADVGLLRVLDNAFTAPGGDAVVLGCDGACGLDSFEVDGNLLDGGAGALRVTASGPGQLTDNVIFDHEGVAMLVDAAQASVLRNYVEGTLRVRVSELTNNLLLGDVAGNARRLQFNHLLAAVDVAGAQPVGNATLTTDLGASNVLCTESCFVDLAGRDLYPSPGSPLLNAIAFEPTVRTDWCGVERLNPTTAGALQSNGGVGFGPVELTYKTLFDCTSPEPTSTTGFPTVSTADTGNPTTTADDSGLEEAPSACGCASGGSASWLAWILCSAPLILRRR